MRGKLKHEVIGKPFSVTPDLLVQPFCGDTVKLGKGFIENHSVAAYDKDAPLDAFQGNYGCCLG